MNIDEIKNPCDNKHDNPCKSSPCHFINFVKIHANQAPVTSFVYVFVVVNVVNVLWDWMVWVLFLNAHIHVCLLVHTFVWIHVNFHVRMHNNQRDIGKLFHQQGFFLWLPKHGSFCSFSMLTLLHISKHCTSMQAIIIASTCRISFYREFNNLSDDTKHASIITEIREQVLIKLRFPNFFWAVYILYKKMQSV